MRNLRSIGLAAIVLLAAALGGCAHLPGTANVNGTPTVVGTGPPPTASDQTSDFIKKVVDGTRTVCSFVPTAQTVAAIFATGNPVLATVNGVVDAVCAAIGNKASFYGRGGPSVEGVPIKGYRVRHR
jgi:hypothetical protein